MNNIDSLKLVLAAHLYDHQRAVDSLLESQYKNYAYLVNAITTKAVDKGGRVFVFGNGGSSSDSAHFVAELVGSYKRRSHEKYPLSAVCLNSDSCALTAISNDFGYDSVFSHQLRSHGVSENDVVVGLTTSGKSPNVVSAFLEAKENGAYTCLMSGKSKYSVELSEMVSNSILVESCSTPTIQECHIVMIHAVCEEVERYIVEKGKSN